MDWSLHIGLMGLLVGLLVGMTGVGGAALLTPLLVLIGINPTVAVGTDLFYNSVTKLFGTIQHVRQKTVNWKMVRYLAYGSIPGAAVSIVLLQLYKAAYDNQEATIKKALGVVLIVVAVATIVWQLLHNRVKENRIQQMALERKRGMTIAIGFVLGFIVGLTSIGSGSLFALAMIFLYRLKATEVVGTDIAHAFLLVTAASVLHANLNHIDYSLAFNLLVGSVPGVLIGSGLATRLPARPLRTIMATLIFLSGIKLI
ncbi:sulfite exporter TauE/SafE family protein [Paenibacillus cymbidii]|uniref:sulfite exporter TauE/SafE family protein n=1 Tax=Paenibacillus cymbidii TaxID=1639034 RepID=UPI001F1D896A|nr:sulfite exporter TauE/SafE family protein [Paenibacillus cymbidii]